MTTAYYLDDARYKLVLERQRARISAGLELVLDDCGDLGTKHTEASWGLCSDDKEAWPDIEDHTRPGEFIKYGRASPKLLAQHQRCPFDARGTPDLNGCFHTCQLFQRKLFKKLQAQGDLRTTALKLYDTVLNDQLKKR